MLNQYYQSPKHLNLLLILILVLSNILIIFPFLHYFNHKLIIYFQVLLQLYKVILIPCINFHKQIYQYYEQIFPQQYALCKLNYFLHERQSILHHLKSKSCFIKEVLKDFLNFLIKVIIMVINLLFILPFKLHIFP